MTINVRGLRAMNSWLEYNFNVLHKIDFRKSHEKGLEKGKLKIAAFFANIAQSFWNRYYFVWLTLTFPICWDQLVIEKFIRERCLITIRVSFGVM